MRGSYGKNRIKEYLEIFVLFILTVGPLDPLYKILAYIVLLLINFRYWKSCLKISRFHMILLMSMVFPMILDIRNIDANTVYSTAGFAYLLPFAFSIMYTHKFPKREFLKLVERVAFFCCITSVVGFSIMVCYPSVVEHFPTVYFYGRRVYTVLIFGAIRDYSGGFLARNCGVAFEPGAFQFVANLGLALFYRIEAEINISKPGKVIRYMVYIITVLSTQSTAGLIILACVIIINAVKNKRGTVIILLIALVFSSTVTTVFRNQRSKMETGNFEDRFENSIYVIENYGTKIWGLGSTGYDKIYSTDNRIGSWDMYTNLYLRFGLLFTLLFIGMNIRMIKLDKGAFFVVALSMLSESLVGPITILLYYYAMQNGDEDLYESTLDLQLPK